MARSNNLPAKKHKAGQRTVTRLHFKWDAGADGGSKFIDIAKALSQVNRRAYRQGLYYYASKVTFSNAGAAYCSLNTAMDNWVTKQAWKRGYQNWMKMNRRAMADLPGNITPKYNDFKIALTGSTNLAHANYLDAAYGNTGSTSTYSSDDWVQSTFVTEDPTLIDDDTGTGLEISADDPDQFDAHLLGPHTGSSGSWTSIGLIRSLGDVWAYDPEEGNPSLDADADTDPISNLFDAGDNMDEVRLNLDTDNDEAPYDNNTMPGATSADENTCAAIMRTGTGAGAYVSAPGFCIPFGLIEVFVTDFGAAESIGAVELTIDLVPGSYNGVHAERVI